MKKRLNLLCIIVMLALGYSLLESGYYFLAGLNMGVNAAQSGAARHEMAYYQELANMKPVTVMPNFFSTPSDGSFFLDSVYNVKTGKHVPAAYLQLIVSVDTHGAKGDLPLNSALSFLLLILHLCAFYFFIRLIVSINRSDIFSWRNVRRLRLLGVMLVLAFGCALLRAYLTRKGIEETFGMNGYELSPLMMVQSTTLLLGLCSLIVGEVFAIGLKMKEEQELTI